MSDRLIAELRACLGLEGVSLDQLVADLGVLIAVYRDHASPKARSNAKQVAAWYAEVAETWERLAALAENRPDGAIVSSLPDARELTLHALQARADAKLHACDEPPNRPVWPGKCRDWLAQQAKAVIERHKGKGELSPVDLRRAVAAVFDEAGARCSDIKKHPERLDGMMQGAPRDIDEEARRRARQVEARIGDRPL